MIKIKRLNQKGITHLIALVAVVVIFGVAGTGYIVASHAATTRAAYNTYNVRIAVVAATSKGGVWNENTQVWQSLKTSRASLFMKGNGKCNESSVNNGVNFGAVRTFTCKSGYYNMSLSGAKSIPGKNHYYHKGAAINAKDGKSYTFYLGSNH